MRRACTLVTLALGVTLGLLPAPAAAAGPTVVSGGGAGSFFADPDGDGDVDGSRFGFGVLVWGGGVASGHFECLMAGDSDILGLSLMAVEGNVTSGSASGGTATFSGTASVNLGNGTIFTGVPFTVSVAAGGPGTGSLTLTVIGAFDGVPGDTAPGNGNYDLPAETVTSGGISIR